MLVKYFPFTNHNLGVMLLSIITEENAEMNAGRRYYFLTIAQTLNITRAAEQLLVSQPSLTQYLNWVEKDLEVKLVDRNFTPLRLTGAGMMYRDYLQKEKDLEEAFLADLKAYKDENKLPLRIGIPLQKHYEKLSKTLLQFCIDRPSLDVRVWEGTSSTIREKLLKGELEIGFGHATDSDSCTDELIVKQIRKERLLMICNRENPIVPAEYQGNGISCKTVPDQLNKQLFYQMSPEYYLYSVEIAHLAAYGVNPQHRIVMSNLRGIINSILNNPESGFAYMPDYVLAESGIQEKMDKLAILRLDDEDYTWSYNMYRKKGKIRSADARDFWNAIVENCCEE